MRRSVRSFSKKPVSRGELREVLKAGFFAPSSADRRPVHYVVVVGAEARKALSKATRWSSFAASAPVVIAVCADMKRGKRWVEDCSIAAAHLMLQAAEEGLGTCWIQVKEGDREDGKDAEEEVRRLLALPEGFRVLCLVALGHPARSPKPHGEDEFKNEFKERLHWEKFGKPGL